MPGDQFAKTASSVSSSSLSLLRNALPDSVTNCTNGEYLAGVRLSQGGTDVYWSKRYNITFRKIDNKAVAVSGARFTIYEDSACTSPVFTSVSADGVTDTNAQGDLLAKGAVDFNSVPMGIYYVKEQAPASFIPNDSVYLLLVGTPALNPENTDNAALWGPGGPLDVPNAATLVARYTTDQGRYYGLFQLNGGKADLSRNLASANAGIVNIRRDYSAWFMKVDGSGEPLPGAAFTLYTASGTYANNYPRLSLWSRDGEYFPAPVKSSDGSSNVKGLVYFSELPTGTYYLLESSYPEANGEGRRTFYVEKDRVFRLEVNGDDNFTLAEWQEDGSYAPVAMATYGGKNYYVVDNTEAVCEITDSSNNVLYELGRDGSTLLPAVYPTLAEGFEAAQTRRFYSRAAGATGAAVAADAAISLKVLTDLSFEQTVSYTSSHPLTFTTAEKAASEDNKFVFTTSRTTDTGQAEIRRAYSDSAENGALITVSSGAALSLQNINLMGQKASYSGRAVYVASGSSLTVLADTRVQNFTGGALKLDDGSSLTVNGGANRTAVFSANVNPEADGGAISAGKNCSLSLANAQFLNNAAVNGGALSIGQASSGAVMVNLVFRGNSASADGGAVYAASQRSLNVRNNTYTNNSAELGGAIYAGESVSAEIVGGSFSGNSGGAVYAAAPTTKLYLGGSLTVFGNLTDGVQKNVVLCADSNDVIHTTAEGLASGAKVGIYVIDGPGSAIYRDHGLSGKPFGSFDSSANLDKFVNDRNQSLYGVVNPNDAGDILIYWVSNGISVAFRKVDGFGAALGGATFALYTDLACSTPYKDGEEARTARSANGSTDKNNGGTVLTKGAVLFEDLPEGVYYLRETAAPAGYQANNAVYILLVGTDALTRPANTAGSLWADGSVLAGITPADVTAQQARYSADKAVYSLEDDAQYALFMIDAASGTAAAKAAPDIAKYGVMNRPEAGRKVILDKVSMGYDAVPGASFEILSYDRTAVKGTDISGSYTDVFTSGETGAFFVEKMPYGSYYIHETNDGNADCSYWFTLTVARDGVNISARQNIEP